MRIALCYMDDYNLGDPIIHDCVNYLLGRICAGNGRQVEIVHVNIGPATTGIGVGDPKRNIKKKIRMALKGVGRFRLFGAPVRGLLKLMWRCNRRVFNGWDVKRRELESVDAVIFCGGGLIKFRHQWIPYFIDDVTAIADRRGIPVIFNSVGVEGFDGGDVECRMLKRAINRPCVRAFSVRDDIDMLRDRYLDGDSKRLCAVCDPAMWVPETYGISKAAEEGNRTVGLNFVRGWIFRDYGLKFPEKAAFALYRDVAKDLLSRGYRIEFFTNGASADKIALKRFLKQDSKFTVNPDVSVRHPENPRDLVGMIAGYSRFLAVRMHAAIIGTSLKVPNVSLVWNDKQSFFGKGSGTSENYLTVKDFKTAVVVERLLAAAPYGGGDEFRGTVMDFLRGELEAMS